MVDSRLAPVVIDQSLHGYRQGHRLLSASTVLDADSEAQLLALSDLLTSEPLGLGDSYLSGYPLKSINKYVLARTWLAEGPRPGSVWTHSLLLDYSSLSALDDLMPLLTLFRRPASEDERQIYSIRLSIGAMRSQVVDSYVPTVASDPRAPRVLHHLYGRASVNRFIVPASEAARDEVLAMALWRQMWPGMRRDFAFFTKGTSALMEVPTGTAMCFSVDPGLTSTFDSRVPTAAEYEVAGFARLLRDLPRRGPTRLRRFLGRYAYDAIKPRVAVPALATLFNERRKPGDALASFQRLLGSYPGIDRLKRELLLACVSDRTDLGSLARALDLFALEPSFISSQVLEDALRKSPAVERDAARLLAAVAQAPGDTIGDQTFIALVRQLPLSVLASYGTGTTRGRMLMLRPELSSQPAFWDTTDNERIALEQQAIETEVDGILLLEGMGPRLSSQEAQALLRYTPALTPSLYRMIEKGGVPLRASDALGSVPDVLTQIAHAGPTGSWDVLEQVAGTLTREGHVGDSSAWWDLSQQVKQGPSLTHPYVLGQLFLAGLDSKSELHLSLCEQTFDLLWTISDRHPGVPRELTDLLCERPMARTEYFYPDLLLSTAWARYRGAASGRVMTLSAQANRLGRLARYIRRCDGEEELRRLAQQLSAYESHLQLPMWLAEATLNDAMPFLSAKLPRKPKI